MMIYFDVVARAMAAFRRHTAEQSVLRRLRSFSEEQLADIGTTRGDLKDFIRRGGPITGGPMAGVGPAGLIRRHPMGVAGVA